jgi:uncharacterized protein (TIGR03067 family)
MRTNISRFTAAAVAGIVISWAWAGEESVGSKAPAIEGTYQVLSVERDGKVVPEEHFRGDTVTITKDQIITRDKDNKEILVVNYKIDASKKPCSFSSVSVLPIKEMKSAGLIEANGDTVRLVYSIGGGPEPTTFKTAADQQMVVLKREKK